MDPENFNEFLKKTMSFHKRPNNKDKGKLTFDFKDFEWKLPEGGDWRTFVIDTNKEQAEQLFAIIEAENIDKISVKAKNDLPVFDKCLAEYLCKKDNIVSFSHEYIGKQNLELYKEYIKVSENLKDIDLRFIDFIKDLKDDLQEALNNIKAKTVTFNSSEFRVNGEVYDIVSKILEKNTNIEKFDLHPFQPNSKVYKYIQAQCNLNKIKNELTNNESSSEFKYLLTDDNSAHISKIQISGDAMEIDNGHI